MNSNLSLRILAAALAVALMADATTHSIPKNSSLGTKGLKEKEDTASIETDSTGSMTNLLDKLANNLVDQVLENLSFQDADVKDMTLAWGLPKKLGWRRGQGTDDKRKSEEGAPVERKSVELKRTSVELPTPVAPSKPISRMMHFGNFVVKHYMRLALTLAIFMGWSVPTLGQTTAAVKVGTWAVLPTACLSYIFFLEGLMMKIDRNIRASKWPLLFGIVTNLLITPLIGTCVNFLTFMKQELRTGFVIFSNVVVTLTPGASLTAAAGGNSVFALLLIVITNILGIFTVPFGLQFILSKLVSLPGASKIDPLPIMYHLIGFVLIPTLLGKAVGMAPGVSGFLANHKTAVAISSQTALCLLPWMASSFASDGLYRLRCPAFLEACLTAAFIHCVFMFWSYFLSRLFRYSVDLRKGLILACSQKTLPVSMVVLSLLPLQLGDHPTMALSCVLGLIAQFLIDSLIVPQMASWTSPIIDDSTLKATSTEEGKTRLLGRKSR